MLNSKILIKNKILNEKIIDDKKFREIQIETNNDIINAITVLVDLLRANQTISNDDVFYEIYNKCKVK